MLVCRGPECSSRGAQDVFTEMAAEVHAQGLADEVLQTLCGCVAPLCGRGPVVCSYPSGAWYAGVAAADVSEIVGRDLAAGEVVERLVAGRLGGHA